MKRFHRPRYWLLALALLLALSVIWVATRENHQRRVTRASFEKIKKGMSLEEVEALFGDPVFSSFYDYVLGRRVFYGGPMRPGPPWEWEILSVDADFGETGLLEASLVVTKKTWAEWLKGWRDWAGL